MLVTSRASCLPLVVIWRRISCSWSDRVGLRQAQELGQAQHQRDRRVELVARHLDEGRLQLAGAGELFVGLHELAIGRLQLGHQSLPLGQKLVLLDSLADDRLELDRVPRLQDIAKDVPFIDGADDRLDVGIAGEKHANRVGLEPPCLAQELIARHAGHPLIGQDQLDVVMSRESRWPAGPRPR